jgi:predicted ATPase
MGELEDRVSQIRDDAAKFYKVDFHVHSPISHDWDKDLPQGTASEPELSPVPVGGQPTDATIRAFREACIRSGRDIAVVTDHNKARLGIAAAALNDNDLCVLPGIELTVVIDQPILKDHKIHIIALFSSDTGHESIGRILPAGTPDDASRNGSEVYTYPSLDELVSLVHAQNGLIVAAHIYTDRGYRCEYRSGVELILESLKGTEAEREVIARFGNQVKPELAKFDCLQVKPSTDPCHFLNPDGNLMTALVVGTDCHLSTKLGEGASEYYTYVKMPHPSFLALREAIKFPDTRLRMHKNLPEIKPPRILGIRVYKPSAPTAGFMINLTLGFSDNLTCLIGPRGSGKSAVIDAMRYLFGLNKELEDGRVAAQVKDRQAHTLEGARIEALYELPGGAVHRLEATYDQREDYVTRVYDSSGNLLTVGEISSSGDYGLSLFGWSELEYLGESAITQREMLDCFLPTVCELKQEKSRLLDRLGDNAKVIVEQVHRMDRYFTDAELSFLRLREYERDFEQLNTPTIQAVFESLDEIEAKQNLLRRAQQLLTRVRDSIQHLPMLDLTSICSGSPYASWLEALFAPADGEPVFSELSRALVVKTLGYVDSIELRLNEQGRLLAEKESEARKSIKAVAGDGDQVAGDLRSNAKHRKEKAAANLVAYTEATKVLEHQIADRNGILDSIEAIELRISEERSREADAIAQKIRVVEDEGFDVRLRLNKGADKSMFEQAMAATASREHFPGNYGQLKRVETIAAISTPRSFSAAIVKNDPASLVGSFSDKSGQTYSIDESYARQVVEINLPVVSIEGFGLNRWDPKRLEWLLDLERAACDDEFYVELGDRPIQFCSPGQRCSAMLPIVALTSAAPLIIDQPEDNLDNRLVSRTLFKILARLKETRQIIVATHNPNILVSGDAEQVLVLSPTGSLEEAGSIDKTEVVKHVISLMEGGAEAFRKRRTRYGALIP